MTDVIGPQDYVDFVLASTKTVAEGLVNDEDFMPVSFVMAQDGRMQVVGLPGFPGKDAIAELQNLKQQIRELDGRMASLTAMAMLTIEDRGVTKPGDGIMTTIAMPGEMVLVSAYVTKWKTRKLTVGEWDFFYRGPFQATLGNIATYLHDAITPLP